jgi:hypothetical protein
MPGHACYHCRQWVEEGEAHDCWTTTETALTRDLSEELRDAWERLRETAREFGEQRIYASHNSIMFSRKSCYFFVRPKKSFLEVCIFLGRPLKAPQVRRTLPSSKSKYANMLQIKHRDHVEAPITDWLREAYEQSELLGAKPPANRSSETRRSGSLDPPKKTASKKAKSKKAKSSPRKAKRPTRTKRAKRD